MMTETLRQRWEAIKAADAIDGRKTVMERRAEDAAAEYLRRQAEAESTLTPALEVTGGKARNVVRTAAQKNAARQAALRERRAKAGLVPVTVFVPASVVADWKASAAVAAARVRAGGSASVPVLKCVKTGKLVKGGAR